MRETETVLYEAIVRYVTRIVHSRDVAEDIAQETFLRFAKHHSEVAQPRAWLYQTARRLVIDHFRRTQRRHTNETHASLPDHCTRFCPVATLERKENIAMIQQHLNDLSSRHREVLRLKFQEKLTYAEIASTTGEPVTTVGWLLHEAIAKLRNTLSPRDLQGEKS